MQIPESNPWAKNLTNYKPDYLNDTFEKLYDKISYWALAVDIPDPTNIFYITSIKIASNWLLKRNNDQLKYALGTKDL